MITSNTDDVHVLKISDSPECRLTMRALVFAVAAFLDAMERVDSLASLFAELSVQDWEMQCSTFHIFMGCFSVTLSYYFIDRGSSFLNPNLHSHPFQQVSAPLFR